jgi:hypothetical protein
MDVDGLSVRVVALWNDWQLRSMILLSLWLQIFLTIAGGRRKYTAGIWLGTLVWLAYTSADPLATLSLGTITRNQGGSNCTPKNESITPAFWSSMLLVHLGGPYTFTAYAVEDNELWSRHVLQLLTQLSMSFYASLRSWWSMDPLRYLAIPIFIAGIMKYGERVLVLWLASSNKFRDSANEERKLLREQLDNKIPRDDFDNMDATRCDKVLGFDRIRPEAKHLHEAHFLFRILKLLYGDYLVTYPTHMSSYNILKRKSAAKAFELIGVELGFMFDVLFTKAMTGVGWRPRLFLRSINFLLSVSALLAFWIMPRNSKAYSEIDITISYLLLGGAVVLDIYSVIWMLLSDWTMLWLSKKREPLAESICQFIYSSRWLSSLIHKKRWKESMNQHAIHKHIEQSVPMGNLISKGHNFRRWKEDVDCYLKELIFERLLDMRSRYSRQDDQRMILAERGDHALRSNGCSEKFGWSVVDIDFHESFLLWHIATWFCHVGHTESPHVKVSRSLASYMLYLRSDMPFMLPKEMGEAKYMSTSVEATFQVEEGQTEGSVLSDGRNLASALDLLETEDGWSDETKWEMISQVWVEMLTFAAIHCGWKEHAKALSQGGELLTFVAVLMSHLGISEQCIYK